MSRFGYPRSFGTGKHDARDWGATRSGTTPRQTELQACIDEVSALGGGVVFWPDMLPITAAITVKPNVRIELHDQTSGIEAGAGFAGSTSMIAMQADTTLRGGRIDAATQELTCLRVTGDRVEITDNDIGRGHSRERTGVEVVSATDARIEGNHIHDVGRGVWVRNDSDRFVVARNIIERCPAYGFSATGNLTDGTASNFRVEDNEIRTNANQPWTDTTGPRHPLYFTTGGSGKYTKGLIRGNRILGNGSAFVDGTGNADALAAYDTQVCIIADNYIERGGDVGLALWRSIGNVVTGNLVRYNHGVGITALSDRNSLIASNSCVGNRQNYSGTLTLTYGGIRVEQDISNGLAPSNGTSVVGNHCYDDQVVPTQDYQVVVRSGQVNIHVAHNTGEGNTQGTVLWEGATLTNESEQTLHSPDGTRWKLRVSDAGAISAATAD